MKEGPQSQDVPRHCDDENQDVKNGKRIIPQSSRSAIEALSLLPGNIHSCCAEDRPGPAQIRHKQPVITIDSHMIAFVHSHDVLVTF